MVSRREFVRAVAGTVAAASAARRLGALETRSRLERIGLQLYTVRDEMAKSVETTLQRVAATGYTEVEFAGYFGRDPARLRETLDRAGLTAPSAHVGLDALENQWPAAATA